jgi:2-oxoglutarate ferredoxin oxidoreductase subunit beta
VAFNNHPGSTKSYDYVREHNEAVSRIDFIAPREEITADTAPGEVVDVRQHDGTLLRLRSLHADYDPTDRYAAMAFMQRTRRAARSSPGCCTSTRWRPTCTRR